MTLSRRYVPRAMQLGQQVQCLRHGRVAVAGHDRHGWPLCRVGGTHGNRLVPILCPPLTDMVRQESERDVAVALGVSRSTVQRWRKALGVGRFTAGTRRLWSELTPERLSAESRVRGGRATGQIQRERARRRSL